MEKSFIETQEGIARCIKGIELYEEIQCFNAHIANVNDISMSYLEFGPTEGIPLIWAHGSGSTAYELLNVQAGLVSLGYRVLSIDYRGHGNTQLGDEDPIPSLYHIADDIAALMESLGINKAVVGGLSKGGFVAAAFYDTYPKRVLGLLLEDGGSWANFRLADDIELGIVQPGDVPYLEEESKRLFDPDTSFCNEVEAVQAIWRAYSPAIKRNTTIEYFAWLFSCLSQESGGGWAYHCNIFRLMGHERSSTGFYSRLPLMQQSQELMNPLVIFRNLDVPMHIIDPVSPDDWLPVRHQNEALKKMHPDFIEHEVYDYEHSPHEAHFERPERFVASAKQLLDKVIERK